MHPQGVEVRSKLVKLPTPVKLKLLKFLTLFTPTLRFGQLDTKNLGNRQERLLQAYERFVVAIGYLLTNNLNALLREQLTQPIAEFRSDIDVALFLQKRENRILGFRMLDLTQ